MKANRRALVFAGAVIAALFLTLSTNAAEEGGATGAEATTEVFKWINFVLVILAVVWLWRRLATPKLNRSRERIGSFIAQASSAKAAADAQLNLEKEVAELRALAERESAAEVERIRTATRSDMGKIAVAAKAEIEAAERAARLELKALAAKLAVDGAESLLTKQLTAQAQASLISNFVKSLEGMPN